MTTSTETTPTEAPKSTAVVSVALVGNPNTGKTTLFNALTGLRHRVGNYAGVTVETKTGRAVRPNGVLEITDLPGTYSLAPRSPDEMLAVDLLLGHRREVARPQVVVCIIDASNLERNLYLATQVLELGIPTVIALNMLDVAEEHGITIDIPALSRNLGVPVVGIQANAGRGIGELFDTLRDAAGGPTPSKRAAFPEPFRQAVTTLSHWVAEHPPVQDDGSPPPEPYLLERALLDVGGSSERRLVVRYGEDFRGVLQETRTHLAEAGCKVPAVEARTRYAWIGESTANAVRRPKERKVTWSDRLDKVLLHRVWGLVVFLGLMMLVFQSIYFWATPLMDVIDAFFAFAGGLAAEWLPAGPLRDLVVGGVIPGVGGVLIFLPQIMILFGFLAVLEDCGYMARAAFLMDKTMSRCGLSGKSFIPMLSSFACAIPGVMAARVIEDRRDRLATILVAPLMSCSARLPVYALLIAAFVPERTVAGFLGLQGLTLFAMYCLGLVIAPLVALLLKRTLLRGETPVFLMELPAYKLPSFAMVYSVVQRMVDRGWAFVRRAGTVILASSLVIWALQYYPRPANIAEQFESEISPRQAELQPLVAELEPANDALEELLEERASVSRTLATYFAAQAHPDEEPADDVEAGLREYLTRYREIDARVEANRTQHATERQRREELEQEILRLQHRQASAYQSQSILGRVGHAVEPVVEPLGWDWRIGAAAIAAFPAREVVIAAMGTIFSVGSEVDEESVELEEALQNATWPDGEPLFDLAVALSLMVFFALCCQCASTLAVIRRETGTWRWPIFAFVYMTLMAYVAAFVTYQVASRWFVA